MKYETIPVIVDAQQFQLDEHGRSTVFGVDQVECSCDAMDHYACNQHGDPKTRSYALDFGRGEFIRLGDWVVVFPEGGKVGYSKKEFVKKFRPRVKPAD